MWLQLKWSISDRFPINTCSCIRTKCDVYVHVLYQWLTITLSYFWNECATFTKLRKVKDKLKGTGNNTHSSSLLCCVLTFFLYFHFHLPGFCLDLPLKDLCMQKKTPQQIHLIYLHNKEIYCIFRTCCKICFIFHKMSFIS